MVWAINWASMPDAAVAMSPAGSLANSMSLGRAAAYLELVLQLGQLLCMVVSLLLQPLCELGVFECKGRLHKEFKAGNREQACALVSLVLKLTLLPAPSVS
jgi:hypothetical protein